MQARLQSPLEAHVYVISLAKAVERRQSMQDNLANFAVNVSFVDAMQATLQAEVHMHAFQAVGTPCQQSVLSSAVKAGHYGEAAQWLA